MTTVSVSSWSTVKESNPNESPRGIMAGVRAIVDGIAGSKVLASGQYTPTLSAVTNVATAGLTAAWYDRKGAIVRATVIATFDPTATATFQARISLPVASNFAAQANASGQAISSNATDTGYIIADATNDKALMVAVPTDIANRTWHIDFSYRVI